ncbi:MAG: TetR family transcriptional regulator [Alphaproteobacteria bacterium]|nr:TetR family transcriptional regulator [Alphaproteobacteria bacterium]
MRHDILHAARRVAERDGARKLSLRSVAAEAGFAPAALYVYFRNKDELMLALAADDLARIAQGMRDAASQKDGKQKLGAAATAALDLLINTETLAAASLALAPEAAGTESERVLNGRMISVLTALSAAAGAPAHSRESQADVMLAASALAGIAMLARGGRLQALGFSAAEVLSRLNRILQPAT